MIQGYSLFFQSRLDNKKMPNSNILNFPFRVAHLSKGISWEIIYHIYDQQKGQYIRYRKKINRQIKHLTTYQEKLDLANFLVKEINNQLMAKYSLINPTTKGYVSKQVVEKKDILFTSLLEKFIEEKNKDYESKDLRFDSLKTYKNRVNSILSYLEHSGQENISVYNINSFFLKGISNYIYHTKKGSAVHHNNILKFLILINNWLINEGIEINLKKTKLPLKKITKKVRTTIKPEWRNSIITHLSISKPAYLTLCMFTYYTFIRAKELSYLQVKHINLLDSTVTLDASFSKNKKTEKVTIPRGLLKYIKTLNLEKHPNNYYVFSDNNFMPGLNRLSYHSIGYEWNKMKKEIGLPKEYQWYSLKDTGIEDLLHQGTPLLEVQRQCRHSDIKMTQKYIKSTISEASPYIENAKNKFSQPDPM